MNACVIKNRCILFISFLLTVSHPFPFPCNKQTAHLTRISRHSRTDSYLRFSRSWILCKQNLFFIQNDECPKVLTAFSRPHCKQIHFERRATPTNFEYFPEIYRFKSIRNRWRTFRKSLCTHVAAGLVGIVCTQFNPADLCSSLLRREKRTFFFWRNKCRSHLMRSKQ